MAGTTTQEKDPGPRRTILIAEDDPSIREMLSRALSRRYLVRAANDGASALAMASKETPDLLLTDVMMPTMDGFHLAQRVRLLPGLTRLPIIFLTAKDSPRDRIAGIQLGAKHYIVKPFSIRDVLERVKTVLGG